jgi:hypothetical protein
MSSFADSTFVTKFVSEWSSVFQRTESKLRPAVKTISNVEGSTFSVPTYGKVVAGRNKSRHADVAPANLEQGRTSGTLIPIQIGEYIDNVDQLRTNADLRMATINALTASVNREIDTIILEALNLCSNTEITGNAYAATHVVAANKALTAADVPFENRFAVISPGALEDMLNDTKMVNRDYIASEGYGKGYVKGVLGFDHIVFPDLPDSTWTGGASAVTSGKKRCFYFSKDAVYLGIGKEPKLEINYVPQKMSWFVGVEAMVGATIVQMAAVQRGQIDD